MINTNELAKLFDMSEQEVEEVRNAFHEYALVKDSQSYKDQCKMYEGIHHESTGETSLRNWLACVRWLKSRGLVDHIYKVIGTFHYDSGKQTETYTTNIPNNSSAD